MRAKCGPKEIADNLARTGASIIGQDPFTAALVVNSGINRVYEVVGQYTWGYDITPDLKVRVINPVWKRFK